MIEQLFIGSHDTDTARAAGLFRLLGDESRLAILCACFDGPLHVQEIARRTGLSPSLVSHHLRHLKDGRLMAAERQGQRVFYRLDDAHVRRAVADMLEHAREGS